MPNPLSPQSKAIIDCLLNGEAVKNASLTVGPFTGPTRQLLRVFIAHRDAITSSKGEEQAQLIRKQYIAASQASTSDSDERPPQTSAYNPDVVPAAQWRIFSLRCSSIRGIAPPGETFTLDFDLQSHLIYGPNGSGKTSLLGAITWILTGESITDCNDPEESAPLYASEGHAKPGSKLRDWPVVATLPTSGDVMKSLPSCWGELLLVRPSDSSRFWLRRKHGAQLEASSDGTTYAPAGSLDRFGIHPLDIQLSVIAPTVFGRRSIEDAEDTRRILSLMLGYEDLEQLGQLASTLSTNRTKLFNKEKAGLAGKIAEMKSSLATLPLQLPDGSAEQLRLKSLATSASVTLDQLKAEKDRIGEAAAMAEKHLAVTLGLAMEKDKAPEGLADRLTIAVDHLGKGFSTVFPALESLRLETALPATSEATSPQRLVALEQAFDSFIDDAIQQIGRRYEWWIEESAPLSKAALYLKAAPLFDVATSVCPVCESPIQDDGLKQRLISLKAADPVFSAELRTFFADLLQSLGGTLTSHAGKLPSDAPATAIDKDWLKVKSTFLGDIFATAAAELDERVTTVRDGCSPIIPGEPELLPKDCEDAFRQTAATFVAAIGTSRRVIAVLKWSSEHFGRVENDLTRIFLDADVASQSLFATLNRGKTSAALVKPLIAVSTALASAATMRTTIGLLETNHAVLGSLETPIDDLKQLCKLAEDAVKTSFTAIRELTAANLKHLYPETSTGMRAGWLKIGTGRDKTVEARLSSHLCDVPGRHFANAGLQRAIALAFYFALLEKHRGGLGFIMMDDPILSLDEEHRERWSTHILRPKLATHQVILATHQKQYLRNCAPDFASGRVIELNPRDRSRRISWQPGDRLSRAEEQCSQGSWPEAVLSLRKYREDTLITLDAYSPEAFFDQGLLATSLDRYARFTSPHPLASDVQRKIVERFRSHKVTTVLDPAMHSKTEADVTKPMVEDCIAVLNDGATQIEHEFTRLERLRIRSLRASVIESHIVEFPKLASNVTWSTQLELPIVGAAAAKSNGWSVDMDDSLSGATFESGAAIQIVGSGFEPVGRHGEWALLADDGAAINDGDLVAATDRDSGNYLRRVWSASHEWVLQSINPVEPVASVVVNKRTTTLRKVTGLLYSPPGTATSRPSKPCEWLPCASLKAETILSALKAIEVRGSSLEPLARSGQLILIKEPLQNTKTCDNGDLAVVEIGGDNAESVIKQVFAGKQHWTLVSANPVDRIEPMVVEAAAIQRVWIVQGVLFESGRTESSQ